ncbi:hypothetical protein ACFQYP_32655 [Nonomuraea antimicrobica]
MLVTLATVLVAIVVLSAADSNALAAVRQGSRTIAVSDDGGPLVWGDGKHNKNYVAVKSPTIMNGAQDISVSITEKTKTQSGFCKRRAWTCRISQWMGY